MPNVNVSATLSASALAAIKADLADIQTKLPFLITLTPSQRKQLVKTGPNSVSFVENALAAAQNNPTILPASFDLDAFKSDVDLFATLTDLNTTIAQLASEVDDTRMAAGSEAMAEARQVYGYVKAAVKTLPGLKPVAEQLAKRFKHASAKKAVPTAAQ